MNDGISDRGPVQVELGVGGRHVGLEVDPDPAKAPQVVEDAPGVELTEHLLEVRLQGQGQGFKSDP